MERFVAVLIEHAAGNFPLWLTPTQVNSLPISDKHNEYGENLLKLLKKHDIRALVDPRSEKTGRKIRDAEMSKVPYMLIIGDKESESQSVSVRKHGGEDLGTMSTEDFIQHIKNEIDLILEEKKAI